MKMKTILDLAAWVIGCLILTFALDYFIPGLDGKGAIWVAAAIMLCTSFYARAHHDLENLKI